MRHPNPLMNEPAPTDDELMGAFDKMAAAIIETATLFVSLAPGLAGEPRSSDRTDRLRAARVMLDAALAPNLRDRITPEQRQAFQEARTLIRGLR